MPYKIVKTIENGSYMLSTIPEAWESEGILYWPLTSTALNRLRKKEDSVPEINWRKLNCVVKKTGICGYVEARLIEKELSEFTSSETEQYFECDPNQRKRVYSGRTNEIRQLSNFDDMFGTPQSTVTSPAKQETSSYQQAMEPSVNEINLDSAITETGEEIVDISLMVQQINNIEQRLSSLEKSVQNSNAQINTKLDRILYLLEQQRSPQSNETNDNTDVLKSLPFPLTELDQIQELESKLLDPEFKRKMIIELQKIHGKAGRLDGKKIAYRLTDWLFNRRLLTLFTWTGCSKNKNKYSFLAFKQIIDVVFQVVSAVDVTFNYNEVEQFFKVNILKYSASRAEQVERVESPKSKKKLRGAIYPPVVNNDEVIDVNLLSPSEKDKIP